MTAIYQVVFYYISFTTVVSASVFLPFFLSIHVYMHTYMRARVLRAPRLLLSYGASARDRRTAAMELQWSAHPTCARVWTSTPLSIMARIRDDRRIFRATCYAPRFNSGFEGFLPARASSDTINQNYNPYIKQLLPVYEYIVYLLKWIKATEFF